MGQVRHRSAMTAHAVRAAIQRMQASLAQLSKELGINPTTVAKWRKRTTLEDLKTGPKEPRLFPVSVAECKCSGAGGPRNRLDRNVAVNGGQRIWRWPAGNRLARRPVL